MKFTKNERQISLFLLEIVLDFVFQLLEKLAKYVEKPQNQQLTLQSFNSHSELKLRKVVTREYNHYQLKHLKSYVISLFEV